MSDYDASQNRDRCSFGAAGARYCTRFRNQQDEIRRLKSTLADREARIKELEQKLATARRDEMLDKYVIAKETLVEARGKPELGYTLIVNSPLFDTAEEAINILSPQKLPLGWVVLMLRQVVEVRKAAGDPDAQ